MLVKKGKDSSRHSFILILVFFLGTLSGFCGNKKKQKRVEFVFVHVGKTGGASVSQALKHQPLPYEEFHTRTLYLPCQPTQNEVQGKPMLVSVRHPLSRAVSIWNWRKYLCQHKMRCSSSEKILFFRCTFTDFVNTLAQSQRKKDIFSSLCSPHLIGHWNTNHQWYLKNIDESYIDTNVWAVDQSSMAHDLERFFDDHSWSSFGKNVTSVVINLHENSDYPKDIKELTPTQKEILSDYLSDEIDFYLRLTNKTHNRE